MDDKKVYCPNCGNEIKDDGVFCSKCGYKVHSTQQIKKDNRIRNILIVILIIVIISTILIIGSAYITKNNNNKGFVPYAFSNTCTIEIPNWIKFNNGSDLNSNSNIAGSNVQSVTKALHGNSEVMQITYHQSTVDGSILNVGLNDEMSTTVNGKTVYTRIVMSEETGESVSVMGENKTLVDYIADHALFNGKHGVDKSNNSNTQQTSNNVKQAFAYKSDGTPMYSQAEVNDYVKSKYGAVNYHLQDNGYVALDDEHYTSDGHRK